MLRILGFAAVLAAAVVAWLLIGGSDEASKSQSPVGSTSAVARDTDTQDKTSAKSNPSGATLPVPVRMRSDSPDNPDKGVAPVASTESLAEAFAGEEIDKELAAKRSALIRTVVEEVLRENPGGATLGGLECRTLHCLLKISGDDQKGVTSLVDSLQDERGFLGKAESLMMSRDGDEIHMYVRFAE